MSGYSGTYDQGNMVEDGLWRSKPIVNVCDNDGVSETKFTYVNIMSDNVYGQTGGFGFGCRVENHPAALWRDWRVLSADFNVMFFNPKVSYTPWIGNDETGGRSNV